MEGEVAAEVGMHNGVMLTVIVVGRIDRLHTHVEAQDEVIEVEAQPQAVRRGNLLIKLIKLELATRLLSVVTQRPDVTRVDECCALKFPKEECAVFHVQVQLHVTRLIDEIDAPVLTFVASRTQLTHAPASDAIGAAGKITFLKRQNIAVAIRVSDSEITMQHQFIVAVKPD